MPHCCGNLREALSLLQDAEHYASLNISPFNRGLHKSTLACHRRLPLLLLGWPDEALKSAAQGLRDARDSKHLSSIGAALTDMHMLYCDRAEPQMALMVAEEAI